MWQQKSYESKETGTLYLIPTPIGNLEDMTFRAVKTLKEVDVIAAEDTRQTRKLLNHFSIPTPMVSYHEHNKRESGGKLLAMLLEGKNVGLVSDAGMPGISDPGYDLVRDCLEKKIPVVALPGASAALVALVASGLSTDHFCFYGFLPRQKNERKKALEQLKSLPFTLIFYEAPHRLRATAEAIYETLGNRRIVLCRELTKRFEEIIRLNASELVEWCRQNEIKGECSLVVEGNTGEEKEEEAWWKSLTLREHVLHYMSEGYHSKEAIKLVAKERNVPKREVYEAYHQI